MGIEIYTRWHDEWQIELGRILAGERDSILRRKGASAHVKRYIRKSSDSVLSQVGFDFALRNAIGRWQPLKEQPLYPTFVLLELIAAYQPSEGFMKIVELMRRGAPLPTIPQTSGGYGAGQDLHMKALMTLEYLFPSALPDWQANAAFTTYLDVLAAQLEDPRFCSYAVARMIDLKVIQIEDPKVRSAIEMSLESIDEVVSLLLTRERFAGKEKELSEVYSQCFMTGPKALEYFAAVLRRFGVEVERQSDGVQLEVRFPGTRGAIKLDVIPDLIVDVLELGNRRGLQAARALANTGG